MATEYHFKSIGSGNIEQIIKSLEDVIKGLKQMKGEDNNSFEDQTLFTELFEL